MAAPRLGLRFLSQTISPLRTSFQSQSRQKVRNTISRRYQSTATPASGDAPTGFARFWNSPVGPKTVHFWAPVLKWGVVLAGISDFARPAESLSMTQNAALVATGAIWTRWCFIIKPRNLALAAVNFLLFIVGTTQVCRILIYNASIKNQSVTEELKNQANEQGKTIEKFVKDPMGAVESLKNP